MTNEGQRPNAVLVTGAAGVMGSRLTARFLADGWRVRALVIPGDPQAERLAQMGCDVHEGDVADASSLRGVCSEVDTVYHLAAVILSPDPGVFARVNLGGTVNMVAEARGAGVRHFIYVSSASVTYPELTLYGQSKLDAERVVQSAPGLAHTIVRPTLVYDRGGGQELLLFLRFLQRFPVVPFIGGGHARKRPVWAEDVVDGLLRLAHHPAVAGKLYNFSGAEAISILELAKLLLQTAGTPRPFVHVPVPLCQAVAWGLGKVMKAPPLTLSAIAGIVNDADLDPGLAMDEIGYHPVGVREGLPRYFSLANTTEARATVAYGLEDGA